MPLRFVLLLEDGPRELPFVDGAAQLLATSYRGALRRVNLRQVGEAELQINVGESVYHAPAGSRGPGAVPGAERGARAAAATGPSARDPDGGSHRLLARPFRRDDGLP